MVKTDVSILLVQRLFQVNIFQDLSRLTKANVSILLVRRENNFWLLHKIQSAGAVEYTDYISADESDVHNEFPRYDIKQYNGEAPVILKL